MKILRRADVTAITGLSLSTISRMERRGEFPRRVRLSESAVGWLEGEVHAWVDALRRSLATMPNHGSESESTEPPLSPEMLSEQTISATEDRMR